MADIKDINVFQTINSISIEVEPITNIVNINKVTGGGGGSQDLQSVTDLGATTTNSITANSFVKSGGNSSEILSANGSVITAGTNITISGGTISSSGGGISNATASGTDTYTATISGIASYIDGAAFLVRFTNGNTSVCSLNINGLGAKTLYRNNDGALIGGDIQSGSEMLCVYNSSANNFQCIGTSLNSIISYVTNADSVTITKGMPVYAFGGTGDRMTVKRAYNTLDATSAQTVGLVMSTSIAANQKGFIMTQGLLDGLSIVPTIDFSDGSPVYLGATAGTITNIKPYAPNHLVYLGVVTTASSGAAGRIYVKVQNGYELDELHNVQAQSPALKDTLYYDNTVSPSQWKTASIPTILGYSPANDIAIVHNSGTETIAGDKTFTGTISGITKTMVGLSNVDNTSDVNKPISTAIQTALNLKQNAISLTITGTSGAATLTGATLNIPQYETSLSYSALPTSGLVNSSTGTPATITLADATNAGLLKPAKFTVLENTSGTNTGDETTATIKTKLGITTLSGSNTGDQDLSNLVVKNTAITGATNTKITYDSKGLVTGYAAATTADIADSTNKRYVTDANLTVIGNTSGTNTGDQNLSGYALLASPSFSGTPSLPTGTTAITQTAGDNSLKLATTAFVTTALTGASGVTVSSQDTFGTARIATVTTAQYAAFVTAGTVSATTLYFITV